jgi:Tol biopolymer transport system component
MKKSQTLILVSAAFFSAHLLAAQNNANTKADEPARARLFAPHVISTGMYERDGALSPDGRTFFFTLRYTRKMGAIAYSQKKDGKWSEPRIARFSGKHYDMEPVFHPDGERLFFVSNRPVEKGGQPKDFDIWYTTIEEDGWSEPVNLGAPVNQPGNEYYPSFTSEGSLYYTAQLEETKGGEDLYVSHFRDGRYLAPQNLGDSINTPKGEYNGFVAPDASYIIYTSEGMGRGYGSGDLYIAFRGSDGRWRKAINMGAKVNSPAFEFCPSLSPDGKHLFFTSQRMDTSLQMHYPLLKKLHSRPGNGNGDIYRIKSGIIRELKEKTGMGKAG